MNALRNVFGSDGTMHTEQTIGNMRYDLTTGAASYTLGSGRVGSLGRMQTVVRPDGSIGNEQTIGNMRYNLDTGSIDYLF